MSKTLACFDWSGLWPIKRLVNVSFGFQSSYISAEFLKLSSAADSPTNFLLCRLRMRFSAHSFCNFAELLGPLNRCAWRCFVFTKGVQLNERKKRPKTIDPFFNKTCAHFYISVFSSCTTAHIHCIKTSFKKYQPFYIHRIDVASFCSYFALLFLSVRYLSCVGKKVHFGLCVQTVMLK